MQVERSEILELLRASHIFKALSDVDLERVADRVEAFLYPEDQTIYLQESLSDAFYFILSGRVSLVRWDAKEKDEQFFEARGYFGEEALAEKLLVRYATARAVGTTVLLRLTREALQELRTEFPVLGDTLSMILNSCKLSAAVRLNWRGPRESVHYIARRHWIFLALRLLPVFLVGALTVGGSAYLTVVVAAEATYPLVLLTLFALLSGGWLIWTIVDWTNDYAIVTNRRILFLEKILLLYDSRQEVPLDAALADDLKTSYIGRILGYGSVLIRTYTGQLVLNRLAKPELVINLLKELRERSKITQKQERRETIDQTIRQKLGMQTTELPPGEPPETPVQIKPGALQEWLSELLLLRVEHEGDITYRTHWSILLAKIWLPTLLMAVVFIVALLVAVRVISLSPTIALVLLFGIGPLLFLWWLYQLVDWRNDRYIVTQDMIIDVYRKPLGTEEKKSAPLRNILSIDYERKGFLGLVLNFGTVYIRVGDSTFTFDNVLNPAEVQREVFQKFMDFKQREERKADNAQREQLAEWIELYHKAIHEGEPEQNSDEETPNSG